MTLPWTRKCFKQSLVSRLFPRVPHASLVLHLNLTRSRTREREREQCLYYNVTVLFFLLLHLLFWVRLVPWFNEWPDTESQKKTSRFLFKKIIIIKKKKLRDRRYLLFGLIFCWAWWKIVVTKISTIIFSHYPACVCVGRGGCWGCVHTLGWVVWEPMGL